MFLLWPLMLFVLINALLVPFHFALQSLGGLLSIPVQIYKVATNPLLRRNHALEHATINVIEERYGPRPLAGLAREDGFLLRGDADPLLVEQAARIGLERLKRGETSLAVHPRCGTSILTANFVSSVVFLLLLLQAGMLSIWTVLMAMLLANLLGPVFGQVVQRLFTTSTDVYGMEIVGIQYRPSAIRVFGLPLRGMPDLFLVRTRWVPYY